MAFQSPSGGVFWLSLEVIGTRLMKPCPPSLSPKCENSTMEKCIFESCLKNTETQQEGLHGETSIGSMGTAMVSDDHYSETKWAEHKKLVCREWRASTAGSEK